MLIAGILLFLSPLFWSMDAKQIGIAIMTGAILTGAGLSKILIDRWRAIESARTGGEIDNAQSGEYARIAFRASIFLSVGIGELFWIYFLAPAKNVAVAMLIIGVVFVGVGIHYTLQLLHLSKD